MSEKTASQAIYDDGMVMNEMKQLLYMNVMHR